MSLQQHPLSAAFPGMSPDELHDLRESIGLIGVQNPITLHQGMVIDGWHRYTAANDMGMECPSVELAADVDPRDFVLAQNKTRRHITSAQLALATTAVYAWQTVGNPTFAQSGTECPIGKTNAELAAIAGVSPRTIKQAKAVQTKAAPAIQEAVKRGDIGLVKAAEIAKLPAAEQAAALYAPLTRKVPAEPTVAIPEDDGPDASELAANAAAEQADRDSLQRLLDADDNSDEAKRGIAINGSHATGLNYVPYDGYIAELHRGERIQTAEEARISRMVRASNGLGVGAGGDGGAVERLLNRLITAVEAGNDANELALAQNTEHAQKTADGIQRMTNVGVVSLSPTA